MNKVAVVTAGTAFAGGVALEPQVTDAVIDIFNWLHIVSHNPASWAVLLMAAVGYVIHHLGKGSQNEVSQAPKP